METRNILRKSFSLELIFRVPKHRHPTSHKQYFLLLDVANISQNIVSSSFTSTSSKISYYCCQEQITKISNLSIHIRNTIIIFEIYVLQLIFRERDISSILDVANIFLITVIYEDINIDIISYTIVFSCNPQEKYLHKIPSSIFLNMSFYTHTGTHSHTHTHTHTL